MFFRGIVNTVFQTLHDDCINSLSFSPSNYTSFNDHLISRSQEHQKCKLGSRAVSLTFHLIRFMLCVSVYTYMDKIMVV